MPLLPVPSSGSSLPKLNVGGGGGGSRQYTLNQLIAAQEAARKAKDRSFLGKVFHGGKGAVTIATLDNHAPITHADIVMGAAALHLIFPTGGVLASPFAIASSTARSSGSPMSRSESPSSSGTGLRFAGGGRRSGSRTATSP